MVRVRMNSRGARAILRSRPIQAELARRAARGADAGGPQARAVDSVGANRARAVVTAVGSDRRAALGRALDAARR